MITAIRLFIYTVFVLTTGGLLISPLAEANEIARPTEITDFNAPTGQAHVLLPGATVVWADYDALNRDSTEIFHMSERSIDIWLVENFARISQAELKLQGARFTPHPIAFENRREFFHLDNAADAAMAPLDLNGKTIGVVEILGSGFRPDQSFVETQREYYSAIMAMTNVQKREEALSLLRSNQNYHGLLPLSQAIAMVSHQKTRQASFNLAAASGLAAKETVESYFILALPIKIIGANGELETAAIYGRQANWRRPNQTESVFGSWIETYQPTPIDPLTKDLAGKVMAELASSPQRAKGMVRDFISSRMQPFRSALREIELLSAEDRINRYLQQVIPLLQAARGPAQMPELEPSQLKALKAVFMNLAAPERENLLTHLLASPEALPSALGAELQLEHLLKLSNSWSVPTMKQQVMRLERLVDRHFNDPSFPAPYRVMIHRLASQNAKFAQAMQELKPHSLAYRPRADLIAELSLPGYLINMSSHRQHELLNLVRGINVDQDVELLSLLERLGSVSTKENVRSAVYLMVREKPEALENENFQNFLEHVASGGTRGHSFFELLFHPKVAATLAGQNLWSGFIASFGETSYQHPELVRNIAAELTKPERPRLAAQIEALLRLGAPSFTTAVLTHLQQASESFFRSDNGSRLLTEMLPDWVQRADRAELISGLTPVLDLYFKVRRPNDRDLTRLIKQVQTVPTYEALNPLLGSSRLKNTALYRALERDFAADARAGRITIDAWTNAVLTTYGWSTTWLEVLRGHLISMPSESQRLLIETLRYHPSWLTVEPKPQIEFLEVLSHANDRAKSGVVELLIAAAPQLLPDRRLVDVVERLVSDRARLAISDYEHRLLRWFETDAVWESINGREMLSKTIQLWSQNPEKLAALYKNVLNHRLQWQAPDRRTARGVESILKEFNTVTAQSISPELNGQICKQKFKM